jgi:hypothetical protein
MALLFTQVAVVVKEELEDRALEETVLVALELTLILVGRLQQALA